jgi:hypothetical protein
MMRNLNGASQQKFNSNNADGSQIKRVNQLTGEHMRQR